MTSENREEKIDKILSNKQPTLELFLDNVHDSHNIAAVLRSCDAVGVLNMYYTNPKDHHYKTHKTITSGAHRWVNKHLVKQKNKIDFLKQKRLDGYQIVSTHIDSQSKLFREVDYTKPTILIMGNEKEGVSQEILEISDDFIVIPMKGMVQSLNISVATSLILYQAQHQLEEKEMYKTPQLSEKQREKIKKEWIYRDTIARRSKGKIAVDVSRETNIKF